MSSSPQTSANQVLVLGFGAVTAIGLNAPSSASAANAGLANLAEHPVFVNRLGDPVVMASVPTVDWAWSGAERFLPLVLPAMREAAAPLRRSFDVAPQMPVVIGLPEARPGATEHEAAAAMRDLPTLLNDDVGVTAFETVRGGHTAGLAALIRCRELMQETHSEYGLAAAVDSYADPDTIEWLEQRDQLHTAENPYGFIPGEGAAACVLASADRPRQIWARAIVGPVSMRREPHPFGTEGVGTGRGLSNAIEDVLSALPSGANIAETYCDLNGESYRGDEYGFAIVRHSRPGWTGSNFVAPADCWGDVGAASGILLILLASWRTSRGFALGPYHLIWASAMSDTRGAALVTVHTEPQE